ncbi:MAG: hypothetical protein CVU46_10560 [Chloroflexi bacterium HGW-Chloroflexi-8]|jgi:hypothetical protein|nr:MAG: hypothetical protein CVU46_10560 [Chloroflexi bacterium HGW-Chloroflexi-8]
MDLTELKPCEICKGKITPVFYVFELDTLLLDQQAANQFLGLNHFFQGHTALADIFTPTREIANSLGKEKMLICQKCMMHKLSDFYSVFQFAKSENENPS